MSHASLTTPQYSPGDQKLLSSLVALLWASSLRSTLGELSPDHWPLLWGISERKLRLVSSPRSTLTLLSSVGPGGKSLTQGVLVWMPDWLSIHKWDWHTAPTPQEAESLEAHAVV